MSIFGFGWPRQGDARVQQLENTIIAMRSAISLAIARLVDAHRASIVPGAFDIRKPEKDRIIDEVIDILERARNRSEL
jgi:hypothetical protein